MRPDEYRNSKGVPVPSVSDVIEVMAKRPLVQWANRIGRDGYSLKEYVDPLANIGTLAHRMILADLNDMNPDAFYYAYDRDTIDKAENSFISYLEWKKGKDIRPMFTEQPFVSDALGCGGCIDFLGHIDGLLSHMDFKTGGLYYNHWVQSAGYSGLLADAGHQPQQFILLNIPRAEDEKFRAPTKVSLFNEWRVFKHLLGIYQITGGKYDKSINGD